MKDKEQLSSLISGIYDAALEPAQRIEVLDRIAQFTGGQSSGLLVKHSLTASESLYCYLGAEPESLQAYSEDLSETRADAGAGFSGCPTGGERYRSRSLRRVSP